MALFLAGIALFFAPHLFTAFARGPRERLIARFGPVGYKALHSVISAIGFALIIVGWPNADRTVLYVGTYWLVHVTYLLTFLAMVMLAAAYLPKGRIAAAVKHPMLAGVKLWAFAHLLVNGDVRSLVLFGSFLAYGVVDRIMVKRRNEPTPVAGPAVNDLIVVAVGASAWAAIYFALHPYIAGVALR